MEEVINTLGRRKAAVARIYVRPGKGNITVNNRKFDEYFTVMHLRTSVTQPLEVVGKQADFDITANITGGGIKGQAEAMRLAIARALVEMDPECKPELKKFKLTTRDPRVVERKKPGRPKARKRFQFSKR